MPVGLCEKTDRTILHSVKRVIFKSTGLRLKRFVRQVDVTGRFRSGRGLGLVLSFEIEVVEMSSRGIPDDHITLDSSLHQSFAWAAEQNFNFNAFPLTTPATRKDVRRAFELGGVIEEQESEKEGIKSESEEEEGRQEEKSIEEEKKDEDEDEGKIKQHEKEQDSEDDDYIPPGNPPQPQQRQKRKHPESSDGEPFIRRYLRSRKEF